MVTRQTKAQFVHDCIFNLYFPSPSHVPGSLTLGTVLSSDPFLTNPQVCPRHPAFYALEFFFSSSPSFPKAGISCPQILEQSCILCARILLFEFPFMSQSRHCMPSILGAVLHFMLSDSSFRVPLHVPYFLHFMLSILLSSFHSPCPLELPPGALYAPGPGGLQPSSTHPRPRAPIHPLLLSTMHFMHLRAFWAISFCSLQQPWHFRWEASVIGAADV